MKYSQYNTIFKLSDKYNVLYNAFSDKYLVFGSQMVNIISIFNPVELLSNYAWLYQKLVEIEAIIEDQVDEVELLQKAIHQADHQVDSFRLIVNPTLNCNFNCWYCYENHQKNSMMSAQILERVKKFVTGTLNEHNELKYFTLGFFGGEPLLGYKNIIKPLIEYCEGQCSNRQVAYNVNFTTNGYLIDDDMVFFFKKHHVDSLQITLDGCKETHDRIRNVRAMTGSYDRIVDNIKKIISNGISVILRINYTAQNINRVKDVLHEFDSIPIEIKNKLRVNLQRVWQDQQGEDIESIVYDCLQECHKKNISGSKACFSSVKYSCYADQKNEALINYNGDVYKCTARDFNEANRLGILTEEGKIVWNEEFLKLWMYLKFSREACHHCSVAPLCGGGCRQKTFENANMEGCLMGYADEQKTEIIKDRFYTQFILNTELVN